jgi:tetratricopeptide (TPR) repeat protein
MSDMNTQPAQTLETFEERVETLTGELELAILWQRPYTLLVVYSSEFVHADVESAVENYLIENEQRIVRIPVDCQPVAFVQDAVQPSNAVFFINGLAWSGADGSDAFTVLNHHRDIFSEKGLRVIFWLTHKEAARLAHNAPDFWAARHRLLEFENSPQPEQVLQNALESAWQGVGEYADLFEDTDAKISMREAFLSDLPEDSESTSIRANLLLTLGILHWRKGSYEKAGEFLQNALGMAAQIGDNWFEAECYNALALVKSVMGSNDEAIDAYKQAIRLAPDQIFAWNNLGNLCLKIKRNDEAMIAFQKAIEHNPKDSVAWNGLGNVYFASGYVDDAIAAYRKAADCAPTLPHPWNGLGDAYARLGRMDEAIAAYQKAIHFNDQFVTSWLKLAGLYSSQDQNREALKAYRKALTIDPRNGRVWNDVGLVFLKTDAYSEAAEAFAKAIELDRGYGQAYSNLALARMYLGDHQEAISLYLKAIELIGDDRDKSETWNRLGNAYRWLNDNDRAIAAYHMADSLDPAMSALKEKIEAVTEETVPQEMAGEEPDNPIVAEDPAPAEIETDPTDGPAPVSEDTLPAEAGADPLEEALAESINPTVWNEKGSAHFRAGNLDEAIDAYRRAVELDPACGWAHCNLALANFTRGQYYESMVHYQKSIELLASNRDKAVAWEGLGNLYRCLNDYESAAFAFQKADELDPDSMRRSGPLQIDGNSRDASVWEELGTLFFKASSFEEAARAYQRAIELDPQNGWSYSSLAMTCVYQGKYAEALPLYQKSIDLLQDDADKAAIWNRLGNVYRKLNDYDSAVVAYQNAVNLNNEQMTLLTRARFSLLSNCFAC